MGKASSNKKVARAAKAGGGRARSAGERNVVFPAALAVVVLLGTILVVYARDQRAAVALEPPLAGEDHWHAAYGFYICDEFLPSLPEFIAPQNGGTHTHGDGLIHIHPFSPARSGDNATLRNFLRDAGAVLGGGDTIDNDSLGVPGRETFEEDDDTCEGLDGDPIVQVAVWDSGAAALANEDPDRIVAGGLDQIRFESDGQVFTIAFAPEGAELPPPVSVGALAGVGADLGVDPSDIPEDLGDFGDGTSEPQDETTDGETTDGDATDGETDTTETDPADETDPEAES